MKRLAALPARRRLRAHRYVRRVCRRRRSAEGQTKRSRAQRRLEPGAPRVRRRRPHRGGRTGERAALGRDRHVERHERDLCVRRRSRGKPPVGGRRDWASARQEQARRTRDRPRQVPAAPGLADAREPRPPGTDVLGPAAGAIRLCDAGQCERLRAPADRAVRDVRGGDRRLLPLPLDGEPVAGLQPGLAARARGHPADDDDRRRDRADDRPLGARRDQPLHVLDRDALAGDAGGHP